MVSPPATSVTESLTAILPAVVIGGAKTKGQAALQFVNRSGAVVAGEVTVALFLPADGSLDASDAPVGNAVSAKLKLAPGGRKRLAIKIAVLPVVPSGPYYLVAQVQRLALPQEVIATPVPFAVVAPLIDLRVSSPALLARGGASVGISPGQAVPASLVVENAGNLLARGKAAVTLYAQPAAGGERIRLASALPASLNLKPGGRATVRVKFLVPSGLAAGSYVLVAQLTADGIPLAVVQNDGLAISTTPFVVG